LYKNNTELINCSLSPKGCQQAVSVNIKTFALGKSEYKTIEISNLFREHVSWEVNQLYKDEKLETQDDLTKRAKQAIAYLKTLPEDIDLVSIISHRDLILAISKEWSKLGDYFKII